MSDPTREDAALPGPALSGMSLDRAHLERSDRGWILSRLADPTSVVVVGDGDGVLMTEAGEPHVVRVPIGRLGRELDADSAILLGTEDGRAVFAAERDALAPDLPSGAMIVPLREAGSVAPRTEGGLAAYLVALLGWHSRHRFCANCGAATRVAEAGYSRRCPACGAVHFPRTDPVVIMLVEHDGHLLLGRRPAWPAGRYSVLAGFVSPGETLEEAVVREVREESGIEAFDPRYVASQPWPFPSSLMVGFQAYSHGGEPVIGDDELDDVRWFARAQLDRALAGADGELALPPPVSIAYVLIAGWLAR